MELINNISRTLRTVVVCVGACSFLFLAGCRDFHEFDEYRAMEDGISLTAGNAIAHNKAVQTIDPWPREAGDTEIDIDGNRILDSVRKYQSGQNSATSGGSSGGVGAATASVR